MTRCLNLELSTRRECEMMLQPHAARQAQTQPTIRQPRNEGCLRLFIRTAVIEISS
jgi:hypothetical protein